MKKTKHNKFVCFILKNVQNRRIYAIVSIHKTTFSFLQRWSRFALSLLTKHSCLKFRKSDLDHQENIIFEQSRIRNFVIESEIKSLIISTWIIFLIRESFEILSTSLANRLFFHINSIISVSSQKTIQYFARKSFNFSSAFDIAITSLAREAIRKSVCWL